jgi:hypothetical protein
MNLCAMPRIKQIIECLKAQNMSWEKTTKKRIKTQTKNFMLLLVYRSLCAYIALCVAMLNS